MYILGIAEASFKHLHIFSPFTDFTDSLVTGAGAGACLTGSWGAWSGCSVTCGKGINMRSRVYADPGQVSEDTCPVTTPVTRVQAEAEGCDLQLHQRELCSAPVSSCSASPGSGSAFYRTAPSDW